MIRISLIAVGVLVLGCGTGFARSAEPVAPFFTRNLAPIIQIFGLPATEGGELTPPRDISLRVVAEVASHYTTKDRTTESVLFDGETSRATVALRYGLTERWEVGFDIPLVSHDGGVLDGFVEGWHDFFSLPQGGRDRAPRDRLHFRYHRGDASPALDYRRSSGGIGDVSLSAAYQLLESEPANRRALALRTGIKLPSGDSDRLRGSGGTDLHVRLTGSDAQTLESWNVALFASAGLLWLDRGDILSDQQRRWVGFGSIGVGWMPRSWIDFKLQLDSHSSFYKGSGLKQTDSPSAQLSIGGTLHLSERLRLDLAVAEDIIVHSAPDVVFHSALTWTF